MIDKFTDDKATLILLSLLKQHGIKRVVASPGTTNIALVAGMQLDEWFEVYSSVDERSAAYIACGLASESGEPVVITCTGATASRNYYPGLTEAYYRKLPILAITGFQAGETRGHLYAQSLDRRYQPADTVNMSVEVGEINNAKDIWKTTIDINAALLELRHNGGGPVHINLREASYGTFTTRQIPKAHKISRYTSADELPDIEASTIAIFIGAHKNFSKQETELIDSFCEKYNAVVLSDHTSGYKGKYGVMFALPAAQTNVKNIADVDLLIHIGEVSGDYYSQSKIVCKDMWRVNPDGIIRDKFRKLSSIFEMSELHFFRSYVIKRTANTSLDIFNSCKLLYESVSSRIPELPFGNIWIAHKLHHKIPFQSTLHFGILNSLRSWNFFEVDKSIDTKCNVGGFGIDGIMSTLLGASLFCPEKLYFAVLGDLAFFYDINSLGNRHIGNNLRILVINNGRGTEFRNYDHPASQWEDNADLFIAAGGHFGNQSHTLIRDYVKSLGFKYITASNKEEFANVMDEFISADTEASIIFEVFTDSSDESDALKLMRTIMPDNRTIIEKTIDSTIDLAKNTIKKIF